jgi:predicted ATPase/class 3 adenylate cyclase
MPESSVLTFLFTDIEGSTSKWEEQPEQMAQAVGRHDALLRNVVQAHHGRIVKTTGDGIYAAFESPADGVGAVVAIQLGLIDPAATAGMGLRVRCGLHTGPVQARDNDYFGSTINRTARIMNAAHGGQILVSQAIAEQVRDKLAADVSLKDLGAVRLKGLATSEAVFQVVHPQLYQNFPALRELEATPNNLPQQLTSFVGREKERAEIEEMLGGTRLLTLLGMGGLGKTRLSLQVGGNVMDAYPDGVWFIDLQTIRDDSLVASETARVLGVREEPGRPLIQTLCAHLKTRKLMLIVDNCEQVIDTCADLANHILRSAPEIRILATSRIALRVPGEQTYVVQPLPVPTRNADAETLAKSTSVQLFVERAKLHKPSFVLNDKEAPAVAELVYRLEGIPLAIELAAARVRSLAVADINKRLNDRYKILTGGDRTLQARQQTLRALIDWSYDLLEDNEQILLARLAVFAGGFDLAAIEEICGTDPLDVADVLDIITSLVEKSLLRVEDSDDGARYRMLETIRDYSQEKLLLRDERIPMGIAHRDYYFSMAKAANRGSQGAEQPVWTRRIEEELDNLRAAIKLTLEANVDPVVAVKIEVALMWFRILRGYASEGRKYIRAALAEPAVQASDFIHGHALYVGAALAYSQGDNAEAKEMLERCLEIRNRDGKRPEIAHALSTLAVVKLNLGDPDGARDAATKSIEIVRALDDRVNETIALMQLGQIAAYVGEDSLAVSHFKECLDVAREIKYADLECDCELMLGQLSLFAGDIDVANTTFGRAMKIARDAGDKRCEATALWRLGEAALAAGDAEGAKIRLVGALRAFQGFDMYVELVGCLEDFATMLRLSGSGAAAAKIYAAAETARKLLVLPRNPRQAQKWDDSVAATRVALDGAEFQRAWSEGESWQTSYAVQYALTSEIAPPALRETAVA